MSMRTHTLVTHLPAEDAYKLVEFLDQLRDLLMQAYGEEMKAMLQAASQHDPTSEALDMKDDLF